MPRWFERLKDAARDSRASVATTFAIAAIPIFMFLGLAIDYGTAMSDKAKLDAAADAASMAGVTTATNIINSQNGSLTVPQDALAAGKAQALVAFKGNLGSIAFTSIPVPVVSVSNAGQTVTSTVTYTTPVANQFGPIIGQKSTNVAGVSTSSMTIGSYLDFYLMVDMSGSMGLPTASADQSRLASLNTDNKSQYPSGCVFACHMSDNLCTDPKSGNAAPCQGFNISRNNGIVLRVDSVASAVCQFLQSAMNQETLANQFRVGIYPFIQNAAEFYPSNTTSPTSSDLKSGMTAVGCTQAMINSGAQATPTVPALTALLDTGATSSSTSAYGSGGTHFENAFSFLQSKISPIGKGATSLQAAPYLFILTDGMQNSQTYKSSGQWSGGSSPQALDPSNCTNMKNLGVTISVLYIPYVPINPVNPNFGGDEDDKANNAISADPTALQSCASPGFFHTANTSADINTTLQQMLSQALQAAHIAK